MAAEWLDPTEQGACPVCGEKVKECVGVMLDAGDYYQPPDYGCITVEVDHKDDPKAPITIILKHETADGEICTVGAENSDPEELCVMCAEHEHRMDDYDPPDPPDDDDVPDWW